MVGQRLPLVLAASALSLALAACAGSSDRYPSLAIREVERVEGTFRPVTPEPEFLAPAQAPAGQKAQLESLVAQASAAHRQFLAAAPVTRDLILAIGEHGPEDNSWASAQVALADLDSHRSSAAIALADLDLLYATASTDFVERQEIDAARDQVIDWIRQEDDILAGLRQNASGSASE